MQEPTNATPVILEGKEAGEVDNNYFIVNVTYRTYVSSWLKTNFPVENRPLIPQGEPQS